MTRTGDSQGQVGGISTMLAENDLCPQCGEQHPDSVFGLRGGAPRGCPNLLMGAFPILTPPEPNRARAAISRALGSGSESPSPSPSPYGVPMPPPASRRSPRLAVPWPMPTELDEFL